MASKQPRTKRNTMDENERLATLESNHDSLHSDVENIANSLASLGRDFRHAIDQINEKLNESSRTPWGVLASWAGVIIVAGGIIGSFYVRDLGKIEQRVEAHGVAILQTQKEYHEKEIVLRERIHTLEIQVIKAEHAD